MKKRNTPPKYNILEKRQRAFWAKVAKTPGGCWIWQGTKYANGYGRFHVDNGEHLVHRLAYEWLVGTIPPGKVIDHLCRNRACVNPSHMEIVTRIENVMRGISSPALKAKQQTCVRGHDLSGDNLYIRPDGHRECRECHSLAKQRYQARKKRL